MFEFAPLGLIMCAAGGAYLLLLGRWLLPHRRGVELTDTYQLGDYVTELRVMDDSPLIDQRIAETPSGRDMTSNVIENTPAWHGSARRRARNLSSPTTCCWCVATPKSSWRQKRRSKWRSSPSSSSKTKRCAPNDLLLLRGHCAASLSLLRQDAGRPATRAPDGVIALAVQRTGHVLREKLAKLRLRFGDALLLLGNRGRPSSAPAQRGRTTHPQRDRKPRAAPRQGSARPQRAGARRRAGRLECACPFWSARCLACWR